MEPVTHFLTGAVLSRAGFNRKAAYATLAMTLAAEAPDLDTLWSIRGPVAAFQHHRGWTHTFLGLPFEAAIVLGAVYGFHRWRSRGKPAEPMAKGRAPLHWLRLYGFILVALLSHLLLDWTNNYGLRPFFPFNPRWYAGSFVFIFEPVIFLLLLLAFVGPWLFGLINAEVGERRPLYRGRGWAVFALLGIVALWGWRYYEQQQAIVLARSGEYSGAPVVRVSANPYPVTPFRWHVVVETPTGYQTATADTLGGTVTTHAPEDAYYWPPTTVASLVAKRSWLGEAYLDWSSWPVVTDTGLNADGSATVTFEDLRFLYDIPLITSRKEAPLSGSVLIDADHRVAEMELDGRVQR